LVPVLKTEKHIVDVNYKYLIINKKENSVKKINEIHSMRFFFPQEIDYLLKSNGFEILNMSDFMDENKKVDETTWNMFVVAKLKEK